MRLNLPIALLALAPALLAADFTTTIIHLNDTHDRVEPTVIQGKPYGGMARLATLIQRYKKSDPNPIVLHGGDAFQGTFYFTVYEGLADLLFLNAFPLDAMTIGNHEFDKGPAVLGAFIRNAQFPVVSANLDLESEPALKGLVRHSTILTRGGERIGIIGAITPALPTISSPGPNVRLLDLNTSLQAEIDVLTRAGVNKIVLLTHVGYPEEQELARKLHNVDVIVGGHSHTLLGSTTAPGFPEPKGPYPTVIDNPDGGKTLVVQSWEGGRVLGRIQVTFDGKGRVKKWTTAQPILVDESVPEDPGLKALVATLQKPLLQQRDRKIAVAAETLSQRDAMGAIVADAMVAAAAKQNVVAALVNSGGVRSALEPGDITFGMAISVQPFGSTLVVMDLTGAQIKQSIEDIVEAGRTRLLWTSGGTSYTLDAAKPFGTRVSNLVIAGKPADPAAVYRIVTNSFLAAGGDGVATMQNSTGYRYDTGLLDIDALVDYITTHSPIKAPPATRVLQLSKP